MNSDDKQAPPETGLTLWRRSYAELRSLERRLVSASREGDDPADVEALYRQVETLRLLTTDLFTAAQLESVSRHVQLFRTSSSARRERQQQFLLLPAAPATEDADAHGSPLPSIYPRAQQAPQVRNPAPASGSRPLAISVTGARHAP